MNEKTSITRYQWTVFILCWLTGIFAGMDANLLSLMLPQAIQSVAATSDRVAVSQIGSYILSIFLLGWMAGGFTLGIVGDRFGRAKTMALAVLLYTFFTCLSGFAQSSWQLAFCRFMVGFGVGGSMLNMSVLLAENWPSRSRSMAIGALIASYQVGVFLSGCVGNLFSDWRAAFFAGGVPALLSGPILSCLNNFNSLAKEKNAHSFTRIFNGECRRNLFVGSVAFGSLLIGYWASLSWIPTWIQELTENMGTGNEKHVATMWHGVSGIGGCFIAGWLANRWGRLPVIMLSCGGAFAVSSLMFLGIAVFSPLIYALHALLGLFIGMAQAVLYVYLPELFPTHIRGTAVGFCLNCGRVFTCIAVLLVGSLVSFLGGYAGALFFFSCIYLFGVFAAFKGEETLQKA